MKKIKVKFSSIAIGDEFYWAGDNLKKIGRERAKSLKDRREFIFRNTDTILIDETFEENDDDHCIDFENYYNPLTDKCN